MSFSFFSRSEQHLLGNRIATGWEASPAPAFIFSGHNPFYSWRVSFNPAGKLVGISVLVSTAWTRFR
jgi:hypothetical protein